MQVPGALPSPAAALPELCSQNPFRLPLPLLDTQAMLAGAPPAPTTRIPASLPGTCEEFAREAVAA